MKKSMINVITLALVFINLILTVLLTFSLVSTSNKTNNLVTKVAQIIDLDVGGADTSIDGAGNISLEDIEYVNVTSGDNETITVTLMENGKAKYVVLKVTLGINTKAKDYNNKITLINNGMNVIISEINNEVYKYSSSTITSQKTNLEKNLLATLQDKFQTDAIYSVTVHNLLIQ